MMLLRPSFTLPGVRDRLGEAAPALAEYQDWLPFVDRISETSR
jgi:hypothetical protein